jgi:hypothetical protein
MVAMEVTNHLDCVMTANVQSCEQPSSLHCSGSMLGLTRPFD